MRQVKLDEHLKRKHKELRKLEKQARGKYDYCVTVQLDQDSTVNFNKNLDGFGETIEEAYNDYLRKLEKNLNN